MKTVLSTKLLSPSQKELFLNSGIGMVEYDALHIEFLDIAIPDNYQNYIFTSKNAVKAFLNRSKHLDRNKCNAFCVGEKTRMLLEESGMKVIKAEENASDLGDFIIKNHENEKFLFLCGNLRREELPEMLSRNKIRCTQIIAYNTHLIPRKFNRIFDGILFFSPSGIKSYTQENSISKSLAFCIGNTTANEVKKHTDKIIIANRPTVENVLVQAIKYFKKHD
ncbi:uroporphyrinogen-III synthase [Flagellimonas sp. HMM57]|uniref:uroporphyrinogen-III synthase n=1 Tax=unclassified Flagellimonas TaxID=2644544 RepID=UPI0013D0594E|nr:MULTISPECIES: uroporphyrinogen-III synthase [unclassified Flagellimonas]UII77481.1 uroporphyrinogen-III synthase [Flagellimonas sp. HMM57]